MYFFVGFIYFLLKDFCHIHKRYLRYFSYISDMLQFSRPTVVGLLGSNGDILSSLLLIVRLCWHLGIRDLEDCNSRCTYLIFVRRVFSFFVYVALSGS